MEWIELGNQSINDGRESNRIECRGVSSRGDSSRRSGNAARFGSNSKESGVSEEATKEKKTNRNETETKRNKHCFDRISLVVLVDGGLVPFVLFHFDELPNNGNRIESNRTMTVHCDICCENENEECIGMPCHEIREMPCHDMTWDGIRLHCILHNLQKSILQSADIETILVFDVSASNRQQQQQQWKNNLVVYRTIVSHRSNGMVVKKREETTCLAACLPIHQISIYQMPACQTTLLLPSYVPAITHHDTIVFCIGLEQFIIMVHALRCTTLNERTHSLTH